MLFETVYAGGTSFRKMSNWVDPGGPMLRAGPVDPRAGLCNEEKHLAQPSPSVARIHPVKEIQP